MFGILGAMAPGAVAGVPGTPLDAAAPLLVTPHVASPHLASSSEMRRSGQVTDLNVVVILIDFPDRAADQVAHPVEYYEQLFFSRGELPHGSVADYFHASSHGRLNLNGVVRGWFTAPEPKSKYLANAGGLEVFYDPDFLYARGLVRDAVHLADPTVNYAHFDNEGPDDVPDSGDDDVVIDGILVVHQGGQRGGGSSDGFFSMQWVLPSAIPVDGVFASPFTLTPETAGIGVHLHELGHLLGLPDLYDRDGPSFGLGRWSLMSSGWAAGDQVTPNDLDAWCKAQLGFVDVVTITRNMPGLRIEPVHTSGTIYRMYQQTGGNSEYFLMENRRVSPHEPSLPGEGLLVYHVDDRIVHNDNPNHYKVALEQADGLFELELRFGGASLGDAGDPFRAGDTFSWYSDPSNQNYDGQDSYVSIFDISDPEPDGTVTANVFVEPGALLAVLDIQLLELEGNGDGRVQAGELAGVVPRFQADRNPATQLRVELRPVEADTEVLDPLIILPQVGLGAPTEVPQPIRVRVPASLPSDPYGLPLRMVLTWDNAAPRDVAVELGIGTVYGIDEGFEAPEHGWESAPIRTSANNQWLYGPHFGTGESAGFKYGNFHKGFFRGGDAALVSPPVLLPPMAELVFDHSVDVLTGDSTLAEAGGIVEVSINGGDWQIAEPDGGYNAIFNGSNPEWQSRSVYSLSPNRGAFESARFDLSSFTGSARIRFHFLSEKASTEGTGWRVDNVQIRTAVTPVEVLSAAASVEGDDVHLQWALVDPLPAMVRWVRGPDPSRAVPVGDGWRPARGEDRMIDPAAPLPGHYWLEGRERDGRVERWGPLEVAAQAPTPARLAWRALGSPGRDAIRFAFEGDLPGGARIQIFDVHGRLTHEAPLDPGTSSWTWRGESRAGSAATGVYFARVRGTALRPVRIVRLP